MLRLEQSFTGGFQLHTVPQLSQDVLG
jgi:hypothetical protein